MTLKATASRWGLAIGVAIGAAIGAALGASFGASFGHVGPWLAIGAGVGLLVPSHFRKPQTAAPKLQR